MREPIDLLTEALEALWVEYDGEYGYITKGGKYRTPYGIYNVSFDETSVVII